MKKRHVLLILLLFGFCGSPVFSATEVGTMILKKGMVKLRRAGADTIHREVGKEISLSNLDEIQTGADSQVSIHLTAKGDIIELFSQSFFKIENVDKETSGVSMSIGKAKFTIPKSKRPLKRGRRRFRVKTANALVGVKGTKFVVLSGVEETNLLTLEGSVTMASVTAPDVEVEVLENQVSQIRQEAPPTSPVTVSPSVRDNILNTDSPTAFQNVQFGAVVSGTDEKKDSQKKQEKKEEEKKEEGKKEEDKKEADPKEDEKKEEAKEEEKEESKPAATTSSAATGGDDEGAEKEGEESDPAASETQTGTEEAAEEAETEEGEIAETETFDEEGLEGEDDVIDLENLDETELEEAELELDFEEPEIDIDEITDEVAETTEEVEELVEEAVDSIEAVQEVEITITYQ